MDDPRAQISERTISDGYNPSLTDASSPSNAGQVPTRERILISAAEIFSRQGYTSVTIRQVATRSGIPVSTLSHHFATWDDLIEALLWRGAEIQLTVVDAVKRTALDSPNELFAALMSEHLKALLQSPPYLDAFVQFSLEISDKMRERVNEPMFVHRQFVFGIGRSVISRARFNDGASEIAMRFLLGGIYAARHWQKPILRTRSIEAVSRQVTDVALHGLGRSLLRDIPAGAAWGCDPLPRPLRGRSIHKSDRTIDSIHGHAAALLAKLGPSGLSMRVLATRSGVRAPTIYYHCISRQELLIDVANRAVSEFIESLEAIARQPGMTPQRRLRWSVAAYLHRLFSNATGLAAFARLYRDPPQEIEQRVQAAAGRITTSFVDIFAFTGNPALIDLVVQCLFGSMDSSAHWFRGRRTHGLSIDGLAHLFVETILHGVVRDD